MKSIYYGLGRNAKNSTHPKAALTLDDCRLNVLVFRFCGICGVFLPKGRADIAIR
jgi:hypothetical protein